jgi:predicted  nucleic acid-binding Zn-ribbon protein
MLRTFLIILITLVFVISAFSAGHQVSRLNLNLRQVKTLNIQLNEQLMQTLQERELIREQLSQTEKDLVNLRLSLAEKEKEISQIDNAGTLRNALIDARERIRQLNEDLNQIKNEKASLKDENLSMSNCL